jgi:ribosomal protection tetracycline resistance protein
LLNNKITTLGIFAHANAGKTTLTEQLLNKTNVINNVGRVDKGNTVTDFLEVEKSRGTVLSPVSLPQRVEKYAP